MTDENNPQVTYRTENGSYDVLQLSQDAQGLFNVIVECTNEVNNLRRRIAVLDAAVQNFNGQMQEHLTDDALIEEDSEEETSVEEDS
tara:strand:+ start:379 stop:639 length:261 start_codon:yes stop_codon:yes gene_type:complete